MEYVVATLTIGAISPEIAPGVAGAGVGAAEMVCGAVAVLKQPFPSLAVMVYVDPDKPVNIVPVWKFIPSLL